MSITLEAGEGRGQREDAVRQSMHGHAVHVLGLDVFELPIIISIISSRTSKPQRQQSTRLSYVTNTRASSNRDVCIDQNRMEPHGQPARPSSME